MNTDLTSNCMMLRQTPRMLKKSITQWITWHSSSESSMLVLKNRVLKSDVTQLAGKKRSLHSLQSLSFFFLFSFFYVFVYFYFPSRYQFIFVWFNFLKFYFTYFSRNYDNYSLFRDVPECSGMFRNVPCSWFYRRPYKSVRFVGTVREQWKM